MIVKGKKNGLEGERVAKENLEKEGWTVKIMYEIGMSDIRQLIIDSGNPYELYEKLSKLYFDGDWMKEHFPDFICRRGSELKFVEVKCYKTPINLNKIRQTSTIKKLRAMGFLVEIININLDNPRNRENLQNI